MQSGEEQRRGEKRGGSAKNRASGYKRKIFLRYVRYTMGTYRIEKQKHEIVKLDKVKTFEKLLSKIIQKYEE